MHIVSWNVNGLRAAGRKGFAKWLARTPADLVLLQEVKAFPAQLPDELREPEGFRPHYFPAERPGYSGVAVLARKEPDRYLPGIGLRRFDREGRTLTLCYGSLAVVSAYFPKGRDPERIAYKLAFYAAMLRHVRKLRAEGRNVVVAGDFNTAHREIDLARPRENVRNTGFLPEERAWLDRYSRAGLVDGFRALHPEAAGRYTWWTQRARARARNIGWRIDSVWLDRELVPRLKAATIHEDVLGSDHCPVAVELHE